MSVRSRTGLFLLAVLIAAGVYAAARAGRVSFHVDGRDGTCSFDDLPDGEARLRVECDNHVTGIVRFPFSGETEEVEVELRLAPR